MTADEWRKWLLDQGGMSSTPKVDFQVILNDWEKELEQSRAEIKRQRNRNKGLLKLASHWRIEARGWCEDTKRAEAEVKEQEK